QWVAARPGVDSILLGPGSVEHLDAAIDAVARPLPKEVIDRADELHRAFQGTDASYAREHSRRADRLARSGRRAYRRRPTLRAGIQFLVQLRPRPGAGRGSHHATRLSLCLSSHA